MYAQLPKMRPCAPLPRDQALPAACPACGIILAKFSAVAAPAHSTGRPIRVPAFEAQEAEDDPSLIARIAAMFVYVPDQVYWMYWTLRIATRAVFVFVVLDHMDIQGDSIFPTAIPAALLCI